MCLHLLCFSQSLSECEDSNIESTDYESEILKGENPQLDPSVVNPQVNAYMRHCNVMPVYEPLSANM